MASYDIDLEKYDCSKGCVTALDYDFYGEQPEVLLGTEDKGTNWQDIFHNPDFRFCPCCGKKIEREETP